MNLIQQALEKALAAIDSTVTIFDNTGDKPPDDGSLYQRASVLPADPEDALHGSTMFCELGVLHLRIFAPVGAGTGVAIARANTLRTAFKRGKTLSQGGANVLITRTPSIHPGYDDNGRWVVPVAVRWQSWVTA